MLTVTVEPTGASVLPLMGKARFSSAKLIVPPLMVFSVMSGATSLMCSSVALTSVLVTGEPPPVVTLTSTS